MKKLFIVLMLLSSPCFGAETIRATGYCRAKIVAPEVVEWNKDFKEVKEVPFAIVYTENGATTQVVF